MRELLKIHPRDTVAVALVPLEAGQLATDGGDIAVTACAPIPAGHKVALRPIAAGEAVIKYGSPIGEAKCAIPQGGHVHVHNLRTLLSGELSYAH